jgi:quercetin dioxygenase-like cupin family protein
VADARAREAGEKEDVVKRRWFVLALALLGSSLFAGNVLANHLPAVPNVTTDIARGTLADEVKYNLDGIKIQTKNPVDVATLQVTFAPGASAGWHFHPGPVFVVIREGTLSVWNEDCVKTTYSPGSTFFEAGRAASLLVKNESATVTVKVYGTFIVPVGAAPLRTGSAHLCGIED